MNLETDEKVAEMLAGEGGGLPYRLGQCGWWMVEKRVSMWWIRSK